MKLEGEAKIVLKNVRTGEEKVQIEKNIVTTAVPNIISHNPYGANMKLFSIGELMSGIMLFDEQPEATADNYKIHKLPSAWAGNTVNETTEVNQGSIVSSNCTTDRRSIKFEWTWNTGQANGTYNCICLTNPNTCNKTVWGGGNIFDAGVYDSNGLTAQANYLDIETDANLKTGTIYNIDTENGYYYTAMPTDITESWICLRKFKKGVYKVPLWQNSKETSASSIYTSLSGMPTKMIAEQAIQLDIPLGEILTTSKDRNKITNSSTYYDGKLYIFTVTEKDLDNTKSSKILITVIDDSGIENGNITYEQSYIDLSDTLGTTYKIMARHESTSHYAVNEMDIINNALCFTGKYLYVKVGTGDIYKLLKVNINDVTDIKLIDYNLPFSYNVNGVLSNNIYYTNLVDTYNHSSGGFYILNTKTDEITGTSSLAYTSVPTVIFSNNNSKAFVDDYYNIYYGHTYNTSWTPSGQSTRRLLNLYNIINPFYLATINNLDNPFTKTSEQTLTITYTIRETE